MKKTLALLIATAALTGCLSKEEVAIGLLTKAHTGDTKNADYKVIKTRTQEFFDSYYYAKDSNSKQIKQYLGNATFIEGVINKVEQDDLFFNVKNNQRSDCSIKVDTSRLKNKFAVNDNVNLWIVIKPDSIDLNEVKNTCVLTIQPLSGHIKK